MSEQTRLDPMQELGLPASALPRHIAVIMDGNGRWARQRGLERIEGHRAGVTAVRETITQCGRLGIGYLTLYSFSSENWKRPQAEVVALMTLCAAALVDERDEIMRTKVRLRQIGSREGLPDDVLRELDETMRMSAGNPGLTVTLALNYGSRAEIVDGVRKLARDVAAGKLEPDAIEEQHIADSLYTAGTPDPDLVIRTAGEMRLSNFLLWQVSYSEFYSAPVLWPDFRAAHLNDAIRDFARRERRYGDVTPRPDTPAS